jgi:ABC-type polysaccharide/polyol phosphate export permease
VSDREPEVDDEQLPADSTDRSVTIVPGRGLVQSSTERLRTLLPLLAVWTRRDLRVRYRQSVLSAAWGLIQPVTLLVIYGWVVVRVLDVGQTDLPYLSFAWAGIVPFTFLSQALAYGVGSIQTSGALISRVYFPREVLPFSVVTASLVDLGVMTAILFVVGWVQVGAPGLQAIGLLYVNLMLVVWTAALTLVAASMTVFRRDLNYAVPLLLRVLFIVSPVVYSAEYIKERAYLLWAANPLAVAIEGTRDTVLLGRWPDMGLTSIHLAVGTAMLLLGYGLFRRIEPRMGDYV